MIFVYNNGSIREANDEEFNHAPDILGKSIAYKAIIESKNCRDEAAFNVPMDAADYLEYAVRDYDRVEAYRISMDAFMAIRDGSTEWEHEAFGKKLKLIAVEARRV